MVKWGLFLVLLLLLAGWRWAMVPSRTEGALADAQIVSDATPVETRPLLSAPIISVVTFTNVTTTTATVIWTTDVQANSTVTWRGAHCIFDEFVSTDEYIQAIVYAPGEYRDGDPAITASELRAKITKDLEDMRACNFNTVVLYPLLNELDSHVFAEIERLGLKVVFRLEEYKIPNCPCAPFDWEPCDVDCITNLYCDYFVYFQTHPDVLLFYLINLPLDDCTIPTPTKSKLLQYVAYFYQRVKAFDPDHAVYANTHYGWADNLPQAPVADIVDGVTLTVYATRGISAPYGCVTPTFTDPDYKIVCKDQYDYFIDKAFTENRLAALGKPLVIDQTGFAYEYNNPGQTNGRVADKPTKFKAIHILARLLKEKPQLAGWAYFEWLNKVKEANWGLLDEGRVYDPNTVITHTIVLTDLTPGTAYSLTVGSDSSISSGHVFTTTALPSIENHSSITITAPPYGNAIAEGSYVIAWDDAAPDSNATITITLFYDRDDRGTDGTMIASSLSESDETDVFTWTVPSTLTGAVFVYARMDNGENLPEYDYSSGMLVPSLEYLTVARAGGPITIDGSLSEAAWSGAKPLTYAIHPPENGSTTATARALWGDEFLYVGFDVTDTQVETSAYDWDDDSVSIIINQLWDVIDEGTFRCRQDVGGTGEGICDRALQLKPGTTLDNPSDTDVGFTVEMKVPWSRVRKIPTSMDIVPADFLSVDYDGNPGGAWNYTPTVFSKISWDKDGSVDTTGRSLLLVCSQGPANPHSSLTYNLDRYAEDWGVYCEGSPTWIKSNVSTPSLDGEALQCSTTGGNLYSNVHCYRSLLPAPISTMFTPTMSFWFSPTTTCNNQGNLSVVQALEFAMNKWQQAKRYEWALQWQNVGDGAPQWRYWDPNQPEPNRWRPFTPPFTQCLQGESWHTFILEGEIVSGQVHYQSFTIDGNQYILDLSVQPVSTPGELDRLAITFQLDGNATESPYDVFVDQVNFVRRPASVYLPLVVKLSELSQTRWPLATSR